jgi:hypothetical protein
VLLLLLPKRTSTRHGDPQIWQGNSPQHNVLLVTSDLPHHPGHLCNLSKDCMSTSPRLWPGARRFIVRGTSRARSLEGFQKAAMGGIMSRCERFTSRMSGVRNEFLKTLTYRSSCGLDGGRFLPPLRANPTQAVRLHHAADKRNVNICCS